MTELTHEQASIMKIANTHDVRPELMEEFDVPQQLFQYMTTAVERALGRDPYVDLTDAGREALAAYDAKWVAVQKEDLRLLTVAVEMFAENECGWGFLGRRMQEAFRRAKEALGD